MNEQLNDILIPKKDLPVNLVRLGWALLLIGIVLAGISYITDTTRALQNNLLGFTFLISISVGGIFFIALEYLAGAVWSTPFRRVTEFVAATLPFAILLGIPVYFNMHTLFSWTHPDVAMNDKLVHGKVAYLNMGFFTIRAIVVIVSWLFFYIVFRKHSIVQDLNKDQKHTAINIKFGAAFMPVFAVTVAARGALWISPISPKKSPGPSVFSRRSSDWLMFLVTSTSPSRIM